MSIVIPKIRKAKQHFIGFESITFQNWKGEAEVNECAVFVDTPQGGNVAEYLHQKYVECVLFDEYRCRWYFYHIPVSVFKEFYLKQELIWEEYIEPNGVKSYGSGKQSI